MKKHITFLFVLGLAVYLYGLPADSVQAYDWGCTGGGLYSTTTGQYCGTSSINYQNSSLEYGCLPGAPFNTITGRPCYGSTYQNYYSGSYMYGWDRNDWEDNWNEWEDLRLGDEGNEVEDLQRLLRDEGYYSGKINGEFDSKTKSAWRDFHDDYPDYQDYLDDQNIYPYSYQSTYSYPYQYPYQTQYPYQYQYQYQYQYPYNAFPNTGEYPIYYSGGNYLTPSYSLPGYGYPAY